MRITIYTSCKLIRMLWNEDDYSPDTGIAGKLRDRGRFFITTDARARSFLALVLHIAGIRSATLISCESPWEEPAMRWRARLIRHRQQSRSKKNERNNEADLHCNRCEGHPLKDEEACIACTR